MQTFAEFLNDLEIAAAVRPGHFNGSRTVGYAISKHMIDPEIFARILQMRFNLTEEDVARLVRFDDTMTLEKMFQTLVDHSANRPPESQRTEKPGKRWYPPYCHEFIASLERLANKERRSYNYHTRVSDIISPNAIAPQPFMELLKRSFRKTEDEIDKAVRVLDRETTLRQLYVQLRGAHLPWFASER